ncbi:hypothetical protein ES703_89852 [subsurface metagenome]
MVDKKKSKKIGETFGISGFTLGIVSLVLIFFIPSLGIAASIVGFIFCLNQQRKNPTKMGKSGLIINIIGFVVNIVWWIVLIKYVAPILKELLQQNFPVA